MPLANEKPKEKTLFELDVDTNDKSISIQIKDGIFIGIDLKNEMIYMHDGKNELIEAMDSNFHLNVCKHEKE